MNGLEPLIPIFLFLTIGATVILRGPLGRALADRIGGRVSQRADHEPWEAVRDEIGELHRRLSEVEERMDFAERLLVRAEQRTPSPEAHPADR